MISWQRRDVNLPPDPILKLMAVASCRSLYIISSSTQRSRRETHRLLQRRPTYGTAYAGDYVSDALMADALHLNELGVSIIAGFIGDRLIADGW